MLLSRRLHTAIIRLAPRDPRRDRGVARPPKFAFSLRRLLLAVAIVCCVLAYARPSDRYSTVTAATLCTGLCGLVLFARRRDVAPILFEATMAIIVGLIFYVASFPESDVPRDGVPALQVDLPNARQGILAGWILACLIHHTYLRHAAVARRRVLDRNDERH